MKPSRIKTAISSLLIVTIAVLAVMVAGCDDPNYVEPPHYSYSIHVEGLEHFYTDSGPAYIGFPAPEYNGITLLPFHGLVTTANFTNIDHDFWGSNSVYLNMYDRYYPDANFHGTRGIHAVNASTGSIVVFEVDPTDYYQLTLSGASPIPSNLTVVEASPIPLTSATTYKVMKPSPSYDPVDIQLGYVLGPDAKTARPIIDNLAAKPFYPDLGTSAAPYTRWLSGVNVTNYTTYIYIDDRLRQKDPGNYTLSINAVFTIVGEYRPYGEYEPKERYVLAIRESIPGNVTGAVPVAVQCFGNMSTSDADRLGLY